MPAPVIKAKRGVMPNTIRYSEIQVDLLLKLLSWYYHLYQKRNSITIKTDATWLVVSVLDTTVTLGKQSDKDI